MSVFRVEKNGNYTTMSNFHLRDKRLSLRTIGLLSIMLSLPDDWDYSEAGLAKICKEGRTAIMSALQEMEKYGYLVRERERINGRLGGAIYYVYEKPRQDMQTNSAESPAAETPMQETPTSENPTQANPTEAIPTQGTQAHAFPAQATPTQDFPAVDNRRQLNIDISNPDLPNPDLPKQRHITPSHPSIHRAEQPMDRSTNSASVGWDEYNYWCEVIRQQVRYSVFISHVQDMDAKLESEQISLEEYDREYNDYCPAVLDEIVHCMVDVMASTDPSPIRIEHKNVDREVFKMRVLATDYLKVKKMIRELRTREIKNRKAYILTMIYNATN